MSIFGACCSILSQSRDIHAKMGNEMALQNDLGNLADANLRRRSSEVTQ